MARAVELKDAFIDPATRKILLTGIAKPALSALAADFILARKGALAIVVFPDQRDADQAVEDLVFFAGLHESGRRIEPILLPERAVGAEAGLDFDIEIDRLAALSRLKRLRDDPGSASGATLAVVTTPAALIQEVPSVADIGLKELFLRPGQRQAFNDLVERLRAYNYDCEVVCEAPGEYAVRGGIIDIYPVTALKPYRIDFFGDEIESIRSFDPATQRSAEPVSELLITASPKAGIATAPGEINEFLGKRVNWVLCEPADLEANADGETGRDLDRKRSPTGSLDYLQRIREPYEDAWLGLADLDIASSLFGKETIRFACSTEPLSTWRSFPVTDQIGEDRLFSEQQARRNFLRQMLQWQRENYAVFLVTNNEGEEERLREILTEEKLEGFTPSFTRGRLAEGFRVSFGEERHPLLAWSAAARRAGIVMAADSEIFGRYRHQRAGRRKRAFVNRSQVDRLLDFSELAEGDHLVHILHGVCVFRGIQKIESRGQSREMISLEFADEIMLHVPLHESHLISRYVGLTKAHPTLGKIGSKHWEKTRLAAERGIMDMAADLLALQARRDSQPGYVFPRDNAWQREFENAFLFEETPDQRRAIDETKADMERARPMDRLLCGDVGFGKTEVALRAAFKTVMGGKQAAILVPTTVLAQQHFRTFRERMADYPIVVEMLSRFRAPSQRAAILRAIKQGRIDIIVGTHSLLSRNVHFRDLGLTVIDEEHRFGVRHKETLKRMRETVDVLSMSATPIPRTLYMALTGARDLSVIETPPTNRLPVKTIVKNYDDQLVVDAINHELRRGGQVFYLHNRVGSIEAVAMRIQQMMPEVRIAIGHGQMNERQLERVMTDFVDGRHDVLVCTTIIESGLDIPNCNTIIIEAADRFGLAQLHQIRGRVGRFNHQAYAYLLLQRHGRVLDLARKRLSALRQNTHLGAGFRIAMRDLELRGAGNLLGAAQSGHIAGVGFDLYCQLLRQSIARMKGVEQAVAIRANIALDFVYFGEGDSSGEDSSRYETGYMVLKREETSRDANRFIQARIPESYIDEMRLRIDFYRRLAMAESIEEVDDAAAAMKDRFGKLPDPVVALILCARIRCLAGKKRIILVETEGNWLKCRRAPCRESDFIKVGNRFPRLTQNHPVLRLKEIITFLQRI